MGEPKRGNLNYKLFNHPSTVRKHKRGIRKKDKQELSEFYDVKEWESLYDVKIKGAIGKR